MEGSAFLSVPQASVQSIVVHPGSDQDEEETNTRVYGTALLQGAQIYGQGVAAIFAALPGIGALITEAVGFDSTCWADEEEWGPCAFPGPGIAAGIVSVIHLIWAIFIICQARNARRSPYAHERPIKRNLLCNTASLSMFSLLIAVGCAAGGSIALVIALYSQVYTLDYLIGGLILGMVVLSFISVFFGCLAACRAGCGHCSCGQLNYAHAIPAGGYQRISHAAGPAPTPYGTFAPSSMNRFAASQSTDFSHNQQHHTVPTAPSASGHVVEAPPIDNRLDRTAVSTTGEMEQAPRPSPLSTLPTTMYGKN